MEAGGQPFGAQAAAGPAAERQPTPAPAEQPAAAAGGSGRCSPPDALEHSGELAPVQEESEGDDGDGAGDADVDDGDATAAEADADGAADAAEAEAAAAGGAPAGGAAPGAKPLSVKNSCRVGVRHEPYCCCAPAADASCS